MPSLDMSSLRSADIKRRCATVFEGVPRPSRHRGAGSCGVLSVAVYCGCKRNRLSYARSAWRAVQALRSSSCRPQWAQRSCRERGYWLGKQPTFKDVLWFFNSKKCSWVARATPLLLRRPDVTIHYKNRARAFWGICICRDKRPDARRRALAMLGHITIKADAARLKYHCQRAGISLAP
ncbi:MAG: hypothetical protein KC503_16235 [Myxococcales bacterium]|nr:hypothetical protein [Myxococcales bacterium]